MPRSLLTVVVACAVGFVTIDARDRIAGGAGTGPGLRIARRFEARPAPGVSPGAEEVERLLATRREKAPPDGVFRSIIYLKGGAVRIESPVPAGSTITICPGRSSTCYSVDLQEKTYAKFPAELRPTGWEVQSKITGAAASIASLPAEEMAYRRLQVRVSTTAREPPRPQAPRYDGYTDPSSSSFSPPVRWPETTREAVPLEEGRLWLADLPPGGDAKRLAGVLLGPLARIAGNRVPARHLRRMNVGGRPSPIELEEVIESIESLPLDDALFELPKGLREVSLASRRR